MTAVVATCANVAIFAAGYEDGRRQAVKQCEAINARESRSGLIFNPDGYRSYYVRSECFQRAAVEFRDEELCRQVRRRFSLFSSSWGYSAANCRELVRKGVEADRKEMEETKRQFISGGMRLTDFQIEKNGNGRDFDISPTFVGERGHSYRLTFEIMDGAPDGRPILLHQDGYFVDPTSQLRLYVTRAEIRSAFPGFTPGVPYRVRGTATFSTPIGAPGGYWSDAFIEQTFPVRERSQSIVRVVRF